MSISPVEHSASLRIGSVEFVSPDEIKVGLDLEAPDGVAANAGMPRAFPRINSYVLIANESGYIVAQVEWIAVERSPFPKRKGFQDYGLIDLPFPLRKMRVNPLGNLKFDGEKFQFKRGVHSFPSVGEPVLIPTDVQLLAIVESGEKRRVKIGSSPIAANADVCVDPDRIFGRHLAVLGNTGSGKSCSVAGLIQWSIEAASKEIDAGTNPNARFIVLDPNGEYSKAFEGKSRVFKVGEGSASLQVPMWFWNSTEWCSFTQASPKAQAPLLKSALRLMRNNEPVIKDDLSGQVRRFLRNILLISRNIMAKGKHLVGGFGAQTVIDPLKTWSDSLKKLNIASNSAINNLIKELDELYFNHLNTSKTGFRNYININNHDYISLIELIDEAYKSVGGNEIDLRYKNEDVPVKFKGKSFIETLDSLAQQSGSDQYLEYLLARMRTLLFDERMKNIIGDDVNIDLSEWLENYIGSNDGENCVTIIDLSLVPSEVVSIITAVTARMIFEALQRYRRINSKSLPTTLVMEEAHTFIKRYKDDSENQSASAVCCQVFEKIAREGRKFGLGLVLSSQRPSELSPTVLSQCNSFLLHRISNDKDQELVNRLVPDNLRGLLRELPSLPSQHAILLGWASELPIIVKMRELTESQRPHSDDPDYWNVWTGQSERNVDWKIIADDWQQLKPESEGVNLSEDFADQMPALTDDDLPF